MIQPPSTTADAPTGNSAVESESSRQNEMSKMENRSARSQTPREFQNPYFRPRHHHHQQQQQQQHRNLFKNMVDQAHYFPPFIQEHGRWEDSVGMPTFGGPRIPRRSLDKEAIDLHSLPVLKQPLKPFSDDGSSADYVSDDKYRTQLRNFGDLPAPAHERIRELGNEIVACYAIQLCKFYNDSLVETTPHSFAVFTKKSRTGQRWLMVFRHDRGRVSVKYNKLLTNQLVVRCLNPVSIEVEPARGLYSNSSQETCVFTFPSHNEATKFLQDVQESQSAAWNHREVLLEQTLRSQEHFLGYSPNFGHFSPRPFSAGSGYMVPQGDVVPPPLTPRNMKLLPPVPLSRQKRSPFTVSSRTPRADLDENWRTRDGLGGGGTQADSTEFKPATPSSSVTQSPMRKRSKGSNKDSHSPGTPTPGGGDGDFIYNSLTHSMALQQHVGKKLVDSQKEEEVNNCSFKNTSDGRRFHASDVLVSNKRDVGTGAPDEEFFSLGCGEIHIVDNGEDQFDEIKCYTSEGQLMFSQILYGWNKVRNAERCQNPKVRWWIGAALLGAGHGGEAPRIREFKATFVDEDGADKFSELFQEGANKGNNPEVRKKYLAQSLRV